MRLFRLSGQSRRRRARHARPLIAEESLESRQLLSGVSVASADLVTEEALTSELSEVSSDSARVSDTEILVRFHDDFDVAAHLESERDLTGPSVIGQLGEGFAGDSQLFEVPLTSAAHREVLVSHYQSLDVVDVASPNAMVELAALPNDPQIGSQWALEAINAPAAWDIRTDSSEITVAVADTGVVNHPDLVENWWQNKADIYQNGIDDDGNGYIDDFIGWDGLRDAGDVTQIPGDDFHGVKVAGVVGASGNNGLGMTGTSWDASIMTIRGGTIDAYIRGIDYAIANGAKVINCSWGQEFEPAGLRALFERAEDAGVLMVTASGNDGWDLDGVRVTEVVRPGFLPVGNPTSILPREVIRRTETENIVYPAEFSRDFNNVISVGSTNRSGGAAGFSNYGARSVQLAAPGDGVLTTYGYDSYVSAKGTSYSAPMVSGAAALVWAERPELTAVQVKDILLKTAQPRLQDKFSHGVLDMHRAVQEARSLNLTDAAVFDARLYLDLHPDVANSVGRDNLEGAKQHWLDHGISEGRVASTVFDVQLYRKLNPDLEEAFGDDHQEYFVHWQDYGLAEGRTASTVFDVRTYQRAHADLVEAYGEDNFEALVDHWLTNGLSEGRQASATFDVVHYRNQHPDVASYFGRDNYKEITRHWMSHGVFEGRESSREFDVQYYLNQHRDLRRAFGTTGYKAALEHFVEYGQSEGRRTNEEFGINAYRRRYRDLNRAFGRDFDALWDHWFRYGQFEGRDPS